MVAEIAMIRDQTYFVHKLEAFVDENEGDETREYFFSKSCKILDKKTSLECDDETTNHDNPEANPDSQGQVIYSKFLTKLKHEGRYRISTENCAQSLKQWSR